MRNLGLVGVFGGLALIDLDAEAGSVGSCQWLPTRRIGVSTTSWYQLTAPLISSWITKLGVLTAKCSAAAPAIGPLGLCGATPDHLGVGHCGDALAFQ